VTYADALPAIRGTAMLLLAAGTGVEFVRMLKHLRGWESRGDPLRLAIAVRSFAVAVIMAILAEEIARRLIDRDNVHTILSPAIILVMVPYLVAAWYIAKREWAILDAYDSYERRRQ
jgi:hypothetical protein